MPVDPVRGIRGYLGVLIEQLKPLLDLNKCKKACQAASLLYIDSLRIIFWDLFLYLRLDDLRLCGLLYLYAHVEDALRSLRA